MKKTNESQARSPTVEAVVLHPCPFCGAAGDLLGIETVQDQHKNLFNVVRCGGCLCDGPMSLSPEGSATSWNIRFAIMQNPGIDARPAEQTTTEAR